MSSNPAWEVEALEHVKKMLKYIEAHTISSLFLAKDPTQRDALAKELRDPRVRHGLAAEPGEDVSSSLSAWDAALEQAATTFPEHFCQLHFAAIAAIYYQQYVLAPAYRKYGETFHNFYLEKFCAGSSVIVSHLTGADPDPLHATLNGVNGKTTHRNPPPADFLTLDLQSVQVILLPPYASLLSLQFYHRDSSDEDGIGYFWHVESINNKITSRGTKCVFEIVPEVGESWEESKEGVIAMLLESCVCPSS